MVATPLEKADMEAVSCVFQRRGYNKCTTSCPHEPWCIIVAFMTKKPCDAAASPHLFDDGFETARIAVLDKALARAPFEGWTPLMMRRACVDAGIDTAFSAAAFPAGIADLLRFWSKHNDAAMASAMESPEFAGLRIREKVAFAVMARLSALRPHKESARRATAVMALPPYAMLAPKLVWSTADAIWRGLGDKSTDFNYYSKRAILSGVWTSTLTRWLGDNSDEEEATKAFLLARIENVMQIEKAKARFRDLGIDPLKAVESLARVRYPA